MPVNNRRGGNLVSITGDGGLLERLMAAPRANLVGNRKSERRGMQQGDLLCGARSDRERFFANRCCWTSDFVLESCF